MIRALSVILAVLFLSACQERLVCPAYQSAFIHDKDELRKRFSYFQEDSTPKVYAASKNKYLVAEPTTYRKKIRSMQTVPMKRVLVNVPDSISGVQSDSAVAADLDRAARSVIDSTVIVDVPPPDTTVLAEDSIYVITRDKEVRVLKYNTPDSLVYDPVQNKYVPQKPKYYVDEVGYNTDQDNYMWYLRHSLVLPDVRLAKLQQQASQEKAKDDKRKKEGGFFKRLFGKKEQVDIDSAELELPEPEEAEFDFIDTTETVRPVVEEEQQEENDKGLFKKKKRDTEVAPEEEEQPEEKPARRRRDDPADENNQETVPTEEEQGDDGF